MNRLEIRDAYELTDQQAATLGGNAMRPDDMQVGGSHYKDMGVQPWEAMRAWMTPEQFDGYLLGNVVKYIARCDKKGGVIDLGKARHYLDKLIETRSAQ